MSTNKFIIMISVRNKISLKIFTFSEDYHANVYSTNLFEFY